MSELQRVDLLTAPPIVGHFYLVRTVHAEYFGKVADWPVIGPRHDDVEHFGFSTHHYHVDFRFVPCSDERAAERHSYVLHGHDANMGLLRLADIDAKPILRRRKCVRSELGFSIPWRAKTDPLDKLRAAYAGQQCERDKAGGLICPHKKAPLGSIVPVNGIVTCPLHGLRIHVESGRVMPTDAQLALGAKP